MKSFKEYVTETVNGALSDPPMMLMLRRKAIRLFPNGERVALYTNDSLNVQISVPYKPHHIGGQVAVASMGESALEETALHHLHHISKTRTPSEVVFKNGARKSVDYQTAANCMKLHSKLNSKNKSKIEALIGSPEGLHQVSTFAKTNLE